MPLHHVRCGSGKPQLLAHRVGSTWQSWNPVLNRLADAREVVALDLPGHGETPPTGEATFAGLVEAVERFLRDENLDGVDAVGSSLGGRLVLELRPARAGRGDGDARSRRVLGEVGAHLPAHHVRRRGSPGAAVPAAPAVAYGNAVSRALLFAQFSAHPAKLSPALALQEARSMAQSPVFDALLRDLAGGPAQEGAPRRAIRAPVGSSGPTRTASPCRSRQRGRNKGFRMPAYTGSRIAGIFHNGTSRTRRSGSWSRRSDASHALPRPHLPAPRYPQARG
jgi:pimeloyl-ACP methyl ester carboxylesterase